MKKRKQREEKWQSPQIIPEESGSGHTSNYTRKLSNISEVRNYQDEEDEGEKSLNEFENLEVIDI